MSDAKRPDPKRRSPTSRPGKPGEAKGRTRRTQQSPASPSAARREPRAVEARDIADEAPTTPGMLEPIRQALAESADQQSEQRLGLTARRAAILAAVVCVLTLTIAGPVRTYFAQRTEMNQLAATESALRAQIADLEGQKEKLGDPAFIAAQARERLGFVMPGDIPYQVQLPPGAIAPTGPGEPATATPSGQPWYTALWKTIADTPHGPPPAPVAPAPDGLVPPPPDGAPPPDAPPPPDQPVQPGG